MDSNSTLPTANDTIPQPPGSRWLGNLKAIKQDFFQTFVQWFEQYGDIVKFRLGPKIFFLLNHPALAEEVLIKKKDHFTKVYHPNKPRGLALILGQGLVTSQGELWQKQRRVIQPMFYKSRIAGMVPVINQACGDMLRQWGERDAQQPVEICEQMTQVTLEAITQSMFSCSVKQSMPELWPALKLALVFAQKNFFNPLSLPLVFPTRSNREFKHALQVLNKLILGIIESRQTANIKKPDLLDLLMHVRYEDSDELMTHQQIVDESLTIFTAGHETTSNALSWTLYVLATHPEIFQRLRDEIDTVLDAKMPSLSDLEKMPYCTAVLEESMRRYPPVVALLRRAVTTTTIGNYEIPKHAFIFVNIRNIHHHPQYWQEPMKFDPNRFLTSDKPASHKLAYMPFGAGHRVCLGNHLAMLEAKLILTQIVQKFDFESVAGHEVKEHLAITLQPKYGLPMFVKPRVLSGQSFSI